MNPIFKNLIAVILGIVVGGCINMGIIILGTQIVPPPTGVDVMDTESFKANIHLFQVKHFMMPLKIRVSKFLQLAPNCVMRFQNVGII